jgi:hypothetical protein
MSAISTWSTSPAVNSSASPDGAPEGMPPSGVNDTIRELMAQIRTWYENAQWVDLGLTHTRVSGGSITLAGDYTPVYTVGRRLKMTGSSTTYGTISASTYSAPTTTITIAEFNAPNTLSSVSLSILTPENSSLPTKFPAGPTDFTGGLLRVTEDVAHAAGAGLELAYDPDNTIATVQAYDRTGAAAVPLVINGSEISLRVNGTEVAGVDAASAGIAWTLAGSMRIAGAATLGAAANPGIFSYEYPTVRQYIGDATGYSVSWSNRTGSVTADVMTLSDQGVLTLREGGPFGPIVALIDEAASANNGRARWRNTGEQVYLEVYNDADSASEAALIVDRTGAVVDKVTIAKVLNFGTHTTSSSASAGGASALPVTPSGYVTIQVNGSNKKIPYYD